MKANTEIMVSMDHELTWDISGMDDLFKFTRYKDTKGINKTYEWISSFMESRVNEYKGLENSINNNVMQIQNKKVDLFLNKYGLRGLYVILYICYSFSTCLFRKYPVLGFPDHRRSGHLILHCIPCVDNTA